MTETLHFRRLWQIIGAGLVLLTIAGSLAPTMPDVSVSLSDKFLHLFVYAVLGTWFAALTANRWRLLLMLIALGATLEILQALGGSRYAEGLDMAANAIGASLGVFVVARAAAPCLRCVDHWMAMIIKRTGKPT